MVSVLLQAEQAAEYTPTFKFKDQAFKVGDLAYNSKTKQFRRIDVDMLKRITFAAKLSYGCTYYKKVFKGNYKMPRQKARAFLVVYSLLVQGSKCVVICAEDLTEELEVVGAFHKASIAKAYKDYMNLLESNFSKFINMRIAMLSK